MDRTINEVKSLDSDIHKRLIEAVQTTEATLQSQAAEQLGKAVSEAEHKTRSTTEENLRTQFEIDLRKALAALRSEMDEDFRKKTAELSIQIEAERRRLITEVERANQAASQAIAARQAAEQALAKKVPEPSGVDSAAMLAEIQRVEAVISQISSLIDDPGTELSTVIRKNVERAELESYLRGIRFALGK
jgi:hypothetical protein